MAESCFSVIGTESCYVLYAVAGYSILSSGLVLILSLILMRNCYVYIKLKRQLRQHQRNDGEDIPLQSEETQENTGYKIHNTEETKKQNDQIIPLDPMYDVVTGNEKQSNDAIKPANGPPPAPPPPPIPTPQPAAVYAVVNKKNKNKGSPGRSLSPAPAAGDHTTYNTLTRDGLTPLCAESDANALYDRLGNESDAQMFPEAQYDTVQS
uniref:Uncharacterized protein n=1 Tax=Amphimedon queenslandica TaxID=400682 RepID=A0A1X7UFQ9_AMPQE